MLQEGVDTLLCLEVLERLKLTSRVPPSVLVLADPIAHAVPKASLGITPLDTGILGGLADILRENVGAGNPDGVGLKIPLNDRCRPPYRKSLEEPASFRELHCQLCVLERNGLSFAPAVDMDKTGLLPSIEAFFEDPTICQSAA